MKTYIHTVNPYGAHNGEHAQAIVYLTQKANQKIKQARQLRRQADQLRGTCYGYDVHNCLQNAIYCIRVARLTLKTAKFLASIK